MQYDTVDKYFNSVSECIEFVHELSSALGMITIAKPKPEYLEYKFFPSYITEYNKETNI